MTWRLTPAKAGLLIIDMQQRLVPAMESRKRLLKKVSDLLALAEIFSIPVFATEQVPEKLGPTIPELQLPSRGITALSKTTFSAASVLPESLPKTVLVAGIETHVCVRQTIYDLRLGERQVYLVEDAVSSRNREDHDLAIAEMRQDKVLITSVEALAWEMTEGADSPCFKQVLGLLK